MKRIYGLDRKSDVPVGSGLDDSTLRASYDEIGTLGKLNGIQWP
jgi:hypothetical protein